MKMLFCTFCINRYLIAMLIETFTLGMISTNCYVVNCHTTKEAIIIDPGFDFSTEAKPIIDYIEEAQLKIKFIVNTHGHPDHINGNALLQKKFNVPICIHVQDAHFIEGLEKNNYPANIFLEDGNTIRFGDETLTVMHTPGHTPGSICLVSDKLVFTGDTLFAGGIGRTDFVGGSNKDMKESLQKIVRLPDTLLVYPGHGETTLIGEEKRINPFLNHSDFNF